MAAPAARIAAVAASAVAAARAAAAGSAAFAAGAAVVASAAGAEVQGALPASVAETVVQTRLVALQAVLHRVSPHREVLALAASQLTACRSALPLAPADGLWQPPMPDGVTANLVVAGGRSMEVG